MTVKPNERIDDLQFKGLKIIQNPDAFCFGMDAVLLSYFTQLKKNDNVADLGTGTGILPLLLWGRYDYKSMTAIEIQADMADMASRSVSLNGLDDKITVINCDLKEFGKGQSTGTMDAVISNPPYKKAGCGITNLTPSQAIARHEIACCLEDVIACASRLLRNGGHFFTINHSDRLIDIIDTMRRFKIEPKRLRLVQPRADKAPNLILAEGIKNGKPFVNFEPALIIYNADGSPTDELNHIYHNDVNNVS